MKMSINEANSFSLWLLCRITDNNILKDSLFV